MSQVREVIDRSQAAYERGDMPEALRIVEDSLSGDWAAKDRLSLIWAKAQVAMELGDFETAFNSFVDVTNADMVEAGFSQYKRGMTWYNAGVCARFVGDVDFALSCYAHALNDFIAIGHRIFTLCTLQNTAWAMCLRSGGESLSSAELALDMAKGLCVTGDDHAEQTNCYALLALKRNDDALALSLADSVLNTATAPDCRAWAAWIIAETYDGDDDEKAIAYLDLARLNAGDCDAATRKRIMRDVEKSLKRYSPKA